MINIDKLKEFAALVTQQQLQKLSRDGADCQANKDNAIAQITPAPTLIRVETGNGVRFVVDRSTAEIFGVLEDRYPDPTAPYGTLDTIHDWHWGFTYPHLNDKGIAALETKTDSEVI